MADGEWLIPQRLRTLPYEEQQEYLRETFVEIQDEVSDHDTVDNNEEDDAENEILSDIESDAEESTVPEYSPEDDIDSDDEELEDAPIETGECYTSRDGIVWSSIQPQATRVRTHNILRSANSGPVRATQNLTIAETFQLIMSDEICDIIIRESNRKAKLHMFQTTPYTQSMHRMQQTSVRRTFKGLAAMR